MVEKNRCVLVKSVRSFRKREIDCSNRHFKNLSLKSLMFCFPVFLLLPFPHICTVCSCITLVMSLNSLNVIGEILLMKLQYVLTH